MLQFLPTYTFPAGGATFTVRRLSVIERAKRDLPLAEHQGRYSDLLDERRLFSPEKDVEPTPEQRKELRRIDLEIDSVLNLHLKEAIIRAGLVKIEGIEVDGRPITIDEFLQFGDEDLIDQAFVFCDLASQLDSARLKNLQSPGTSPALVATPGENTSATIADAAGTTATETAENTSPAT